jgi:phosphoribosylglycinamide formyltransferase-1
MGDKIRIGALISGGGTNLQAVIDACESGAIDGKIEFVGSDNPGAAGLARAKRHGIPEFVVDYGAIAARCRTNADTVRLPEGADPKTVAAKSGLFSADTPFEKIEAFMIARLASEAALYDRMRSYSFDLLVLAGFMRTMTPYLIDRINSDPDHPRIMNIHPSLLPAFPGTDGYGDTFRYGCRVGGCTVHFVDYGEDTGPIIGQKAFEITHRDTLDTIRSKGLALEWRLYPECIQKFAEGRLKIVRRAHALKNGRVVHRAVVEQID